LQGLLARRSSWIVAAVESSALAVPAASVLHEPSADPRYPLPARTSSDGRELLRDELTRLTLSFTRADRDTEADDAWSGPGSSARPSPRG
jgi:hypothetical protein